jgi:glycopeptide antibiotics resistance protein
VTVTHTEARPVGRPLLVTALVLYLVVLTWLVVWKLAEPWVGTASDRHLKLMPFVATATAGASRPIEVLGNVIVFVPFGLLLALLAPTRFWLSAATIALTSCGFELAQFVLATGITDTTDVITNTAGGVLGLAVVRATDLVLRAARADRDLRRRRRPRSAGWSP